MSIEATTWAWAQPIPPTARYVLLALADYANKDGECWPSVAALKAKTGFSERTVQVALAALQQCGAIERRERKNTSTVFRCTMNAIEPPQEMHPRAKCTPAADAPTPPQEMHPTPAPAAPKPSLNHQDEPRKKDPPITPPSLFAEPVTGKPVVIAKSDGFEAFWSAYPRKVGKGAARSAWARAAGKALAGEIMAGLTRMDAPDDSRFIPHAATWLNQERWTDEPPAPRLSVTDQIRRDWNLPEIPDDHTPRLRLVT